MYMTFDYLVTTINKTEEEILNMIDKMNISGSILIGNQNSQQNTTKTLVKGKTKVVLFNLIGKGVSKNRNFLLKKSASDYVVFLDDDISFINNSQSIMESLIESNSGRYRAYRFNSYSTNLDRPIKQIKKDKELSLMDLKNFGVWGIYFNRKNLLKKNILFDENVGPGSIINHGEDFLFLKSFVDIKDNKMIQFKQCGFLIKQEHSTWTGSNRDVVRELFSHGYVYKKAFGAMWFFYLLFHLTKHNKNYSSIRKHRIAICKAGAKYYTLLKSNPSLDQESLYRSLVDKYYE